ncbi:Nif11-like leader peptide family natural product precursor [Nocardiopsis sediminis]|uniref:Nif11-like leader peptide family natural product n=1 Tax=Nocardiopsis sediminis TaxID=1778267 RepID=A0ABV8FGW8_9ACTN
MSIESCTEFLHTAYTSPDLMRALRAMTGPQEIIALGARHGYDFRLADLAAASSTVSPGSAASGNGAPGSALSAVPAAAEESRPRPGESGFYHHEYAIADIPGFDAVLRELPRLKIKPDSVDLARFAESFRKEDLRSTGLSPESEEFRRWQDDVEREDGGGGLHRRSFHLVNLDEHVDHPGYADYLDAKGATIAALEDAFGTEIRFSGSMWYPPSSYRLWHTNETQPGWRMYIVDVDAPFDDPGHTTFFRYMNPATGEIVTLGERPRIVRFFKVEQDPRHLFWHCIVNPTERDRWSFGFAVPEDWPERLGLAT